MIFSQLNNTSFTNILDDDITFGKPKKTKNIVQIIQISQSYGKFSFHKPSMIHIFRLRPIVNVCAIEALKL